MPSLEQCISAFHYGPRPWWGTCLLPVSWLYGWIGHSRRWLYKHSWLKVVKLPVPVISVGNLTTGGTGKTPVVIALVQHYLARDRRVLVLSRGYRATKPSKPGDILTPAHGDEAFCIQAACPDAHVWVGPNRVALALLAMTTLKPDVIILDDGFQHLRLYRDWDIILIDGQRFFGNGQLLPLGPLREPLPILSENTQLCLTKLADKQQVAAIAKLRHYFPIEAASACVLPQQIVYRREGAYNSSPWVEWPKGQKLWLVTGIAYPHPLMEDLQKHGCLIKRQILLDDHHDFTHAEITVWLETIPEDCWLVTTQKDWVKWQPPWLAPREVTVVVADSIVSLSRLAFLVR